MAGGKGTRIASVNSEVPKPMIPILGKPILEYQLECLRDQGYDDVILVIGHLGHVVKDYFGDGSGISPATGKSFGVKIQYVTEEQPLGTAGALYLLKDQLGEDFLLLCGDVIFDIDVDRFYRFHREKGGVATLFTHPNSHPYDSGIIMADDQGRVTNWLHKEDPRQWYRNRVNAGLHFFSHKIFEQGLFQELKKVDLDREVLKPLISTGELYVYDSPEYVKDMGTPDRFYAVEQDIRSGKVQAKNLSRPQKCVFLDRDGTINKYVGFLRNIDELELLPGAAEAVRKINESGYLAILATNQPVIARGEVTREELAEIHNKLETLLGQEGAYLDAIYYCPHHPHKGYEGEIPELKIDCDCRKPKAGMLLQAAKDFHIDLSASYMVGDGENDVQCGLNAGCTPVKLGEPVEGSMNFSSLFDFVNRVLTKSSADARVKIPVVSTTSGAEAASNENGVLAATKPMNKTMQRAVGPEKMHLELLIQRYPALAPIRQDIEDAFDLLRQSYLSGGKLLIAGNGGSCADAEHIVGELMKGFKLPRKLDLKTSQCLRGLNSKRGQVLSEKLQQGLPAIALNSHPALNTAFQNDVDGELAFAQQVGVLGNSGDTFLAISTSGNSQNIYDAALMARAKGLKVLALTGKDGGAIRDFADVSIVVPGCETYQIQELHLPVYHCLCLMLETYFFG